MTALRGLIARPGLIVGIWLTHVGLAAVFGTIVERSAEVALGASGSAGDGHALYALLELLAEQPSLGAGALGGSVGLLLASSLLWLVLSPVVLASLAGRSATESLSLGVRSLGANLVQTSWHWLLRAVGLALVMFVIGPLPGMLRLPVVLIALGGSAVALDMVRAQITLHDAARLHIRSAAFAFVRTFKDPRLLALGAGLATLQGLLALTTIWVGIAGIGPASVVWIERALSLAMVLAGLWRMSVSANLGPVSLQSLPSPDPGDGADA